LKDRIAKGASNEYTLNGANKAVSIEPNLEVIYKIRAQNGRSFINLRRGCLNLMGVSIVHGTEKVGASSRTFARKASEATGLSYAAIIALLDKYSLGLDEER